MKDWNLNKSLCCGPPRGFPIGWEFSACSIPTVRQVVRRFIFVFADPDDSPWWRALSWSGCQSCLETEAALLCVKQTWASVIDDECFSCLLAFSLHLWKRRPVWLPLSPSTAKVSTASCQQGEPAETRVVESRDAAYMFYQCLLKNPEPRSD